MKQILLIVVLFLLCFGCSHRYRVPKEFIQPEQMTQLFWDMSLAEDVVINTHRKDSSRNIKKDTQIEYEKVFGIHKVTEKQFRDSYDFYREHPLILKVVLDSLQARSERRRQDFFKLRS